MQRPTGEGYAGKRARTLYRVLIFVVPLSLFCTAVWLFMSGHQSLYLASLSSLGISPHAAPFSDLLAVVSAADCHRLGVDVYLTDPCDVWGRRHVYSPVWLDVMPGFLRQQNINEIGLALDLMFIASLPMVMRPRSAGECLLFLAAALSTTVVYALERGNNDLVIFLLMVWAGAVFGGPILRRLAAYAIFLLGGLLKFYPLALLVLAARETWRRALLVAAVFCIAVLAVGLIYERELAIVLGNLPHVSYYADSISARNLPLGLARLTPPTSIISGQVLAVAVLLMLGAYSTTIALKIFRALEREGAAVGDWTRETDHLLIGAVLLTGCFFTAENISYRGIFLLLVIPGLLRFRHDAATPGIRRLFGSALGAAVFLLWEQRFGLALKQAFAAATASEGTPLAWAAAALYWLGRELLWWGLISLLVGLIAFLLSRMPLLSDIALLLPSRNRSPAASMRVRGGR